MFVSGQSINYKLAIYLLASLLGLVVWWFVLGMDSGAVEWLVVLRVVLGVLYLGIIPSWGIVRYVFRDAKQVDLMEQVALCVVISLSLPAFVVYISSLAGMEINRDLIVLAAGGLVLIGWAGFLSEQ